MASNDDDAPRRRLRIPAALAVAIVGSAATVALGVAGCDIGPEPVDAMMQTQLRIDAAADADIDSFVDADVPADAPPDTPVA